MNLVSAKALWPFDGPTYWRAFVKSKGLTFYNMVLMFYDAPKYGIDGHKKYCSAKEFYS